MNINHFDRRWVYLRNQLSKNELTLSRLRSIEDQALLMITEENSREGNEILSCIDEKRDRLLQKEILSQSPVDICNTLKMRFLCEDFVQELWEDRMAAIKSKVAGRRGLESLEFGLQEPLALEFDPKAINSTFSSRMGCIAKMIRKQNSPSSYKNNLSEVQKWEISRLAGNTMSPEILAHAVDEYVGSLRKQIKIAEAFYFGRMKEGMEGLSKLSIKIRERIEALIWQVSNGSSEQSSSDVVAAILHSVEEQMGVHVA